MSAERLDGARRHDALGAAADADAHVGAGVVAGRVDAAGDVAVAHEPGAGARGADLVDELLVTRPVQHRDDDLVDGLAERLREQPDVLADGQADVDDADAGGTGDELVHVEDGRRVEHRAVVRDRDDRERVVAPGRRERGPVDRVDGDVALRTAAVADVLAVEQHRRFVLLALADHDRAVEVDGGEERPHRVDRRAVRVLLRTAPDEGHRADRRGFGGAHEFECEVSVGMQRTHVRGQTHHGASLASAPFRPHRVSRPAGAKESRFFHAGQEWRSDASGRPRHPVSPRGASLE